MSNYKFEINGIFNDQITKGMSSLNRQLKTFAARADASATSAQKMKDAGLKLDQVLVKTSNSAATSNKKTNDLGRTFRGATTDSNRMSYGLHQLATAMNNIMGGSSNLMKSLINLKTLGMAATAVAAIYLGKALVGISKYAFDNATAIEGLNMKMKASIGTFGNYIQEVEFLRDVSNEMGLDFRKLSSEYAGFAASALRSGLSLEQTRQIFIDIMKAGVAMKLTNEQLSFSMQAITQMSSKGVVSMEELRRQLGDHLPGALQIAAKSMGMANDEFIKLVETGNLASKDFLPRFANEVKKELGGSFEDAANSMQANSARMSNAFKEMGTSFSTETYQSLNDTIKALAAVTMDYGVPAMKLLGITFNIILKPIKDFLWNAEMLRKWMRDPTKSFEELANEVVNTKVALDKVNESTYNASKGFNKLSNGVKDSKKEVKDSEEIFNRFAENLMSPKELAITKFNKEMKEAKEALKSFNIEQENVSSSANIVKHYTDLLDKLKEARKKTELDITNYKNMPEDKLLDVLAVREDYVKKHSKVLVKDLSEAEKQQLMFVKKYINLSDKLEQAKIKGEDVGKGNVSANEIFNPTEKTDRLKAIDDQIAFITAEIDKYNTVVRESNKVDTDKDLSKLKNGKQVLALAEEMNKLELTLLNIDREKYLLSSKDQDLFTTKQDKILLDKKELEYLARKKALTGEISEKELESYSRNVKNKAENEQLKIGLDYVIKISKVDFDFKGVKRNLEKDLSKIEADATPEFKTNLEGYKSRKKYEYDLAIKNINLEAEAEKEKLEEKLSDLRRYSEEKINLMKEIGYTEEEIGQEYVKNQDAMNVLQLDYEKQINKKKAKLTKDLVEKNTGNWAKFFDWIDTKHGKVFAAAADKVAEYLDYVNTKMNSTFEGVSGIIENLSNVAQNYYQSHYDTAMKELEDYSKAQEEVMKNYNDQMDDQGEKIEELREIESRAGRRAKKLIQGEIKEEERVYKQAEKEKDRVAKETYREEKRRNEDAQRRRKKEMVAYKALAISGAIIDTYQAANAAYASLAGIKKIGPALGIAAAAAAVAGGLANVDMIKRQEFAKGGFPQGKNALIQVNERGQEAVLNAQAVRNIGVQGVNNLNAGKMIGNTQVSVGGPVINIYGTPTQTDINRITTNVREENDKLARNIERMIETKQINPDVFKKAMK